MIDDIFEYGETFELEEYKREEFTQEQAARQTYPCLTPDMETAIFWIEFSSELDEFSVLSLFPYPYPDKNILITHPNRLPIHNVDMEINEFGITELLFGYPNRDDSSLNFLEENGLKPDEPFKIKMRVHYYKTGGYSEPEEWDMDMDWDLIEGEIK